MKFYTNYRKYLCLAATTSVIFILFAIIQVNNLANMSHVFYDHMQFSELEYLKIKPLNALLYLHSQPPFLSLILYIGSLLPGDLYHTFIIINTISALVVSLIVFLILNKYVSPIIAGTIALLYLFSPSTILYIVYPFYPVLTSLGYALLCYGFFKIPSQPKAALLYFISSLLYLSILRSSFTYFHGLILIIGFFWQVKGLFSKKIIIIYFLLALVTIFLLPTKNYLLYGFFGSSSWAPLNIANGIGINLKPTAFPSPSQIRAVHPTMTCKYTHDWIDVVDTFNNSRINYNSCLVVQYSKFIIPQIANEYNIHTHFHLIKENILAYFRPSYMYFVINDYNANKISTLRSLYEYLTITFKTGSQNIRLLFLILPILVLYCGLRRRDKFVISLFLILALHFLSTVSTDGRESDRFIYDIEFLFYIFLGFVLSYLTSNNFNKINGRCYRKLG